MADSKHLPAGGRLYLNGEFREVGDARLPLADQGVLFGFGFFESFRTSGGLPHRWDLHRRRLEHACAQSGLVLPSTFLAIDDQRLVNVIQTCLRQADLVDAAFRYTVTAGSADGSPNEFLTMRHLPPTPAEEGICLRVLNVARDNGEWVPRPKSLNYLNALLGSRELARRSTDPGDEGLFLSREGGYVVETARQNVAWIRDGRICYPDPAVGALAGTALAWLLELGCAAQPCYARLDEMLAADAIFLLNSVRGITPVREIRDTDDKVLITSLDSSAHPMVASLRRQWSDALKATAAA